MTTPTTARWSWLEDIPLPPPAIDNNNGTTQTRSCPITPQNIGAPINPNRVHFVPQQAPNNPLTTQSDSYIPGNINHSVPIIMDGETASTFFDPTNMTMTNQPIQTIAQTQMKSNEQIETYEEAFPALPAINDVQNDYKTEETAPYSSRDGRVMFCGYHGSMKGCEKGKKCAFSHLNPRW